MSIIFGFIRSAPRTAILALAVAGLCLSASGTASAAFLSISKDLEITPGLSLIIPVELTNDEATDFDITNVDIYLDFDPTLLTVIELQPGAFTTGLNIRSLVFDNTTGQINTTQLGLPGENLAANSTVTVLLIEIQATDDFLPGMSTAIEFVLNRTSTIGTNVNGEFAPDLDPLPGDPSLNGLVTATSPQFVIPEPSSLALMGLGGLGLALGLRRRMARA